MPRETSNATLAVCTREGDRRQTARARTAVVAVTAAVCWWVTRCSYTLVGGKGRPGNSSLRCASANTDLKVRSCNPSKRTDYGYVNVRVKR